MTITYQETIIEQPFLVDQIFSGPKRIQATAVAISANEIKLRGPMDLTSDDTRYVWLEFGLGGDPRRIRALGEIVDMGPNSRTVRFKHIFPDHRALLNDYLDRTSTN
ncbi:MAG: hypothetical protein ABIK09_10950 [Pseudomonadota bacterium]